MPADFRAHALIRPLFDGPIDLIGDVHGEIDALRALLQRLGYDAQGRHPEGRRVVFVGDLVDRGPDTPAVLKLAMAWVAAGRAQCVLGNHELAVLRGEKRRDNAWFHGGKPAADRRGRVLEQAALAPGKRDAALAFMAGLPLALERGDLRVVHACWRDRDVAALRNAGGGAVAAFDAGDAAVRARLAEQPAADATAEHLARQNGNPVKVLTSGIERRSDTPWELHGVVRRVARDPWWQTYDGPTCVFGHYWRTPLPDPEDGYGLFDVDAPHTLLGDAGRAMCLDYSVGGRWLERGLGRGTPQNPFRSRLVAMRWPEGELVSDQPGDPPVTLPRV